MIYFQHFAGVHFIKLFFRFKKNFWSVVTNLFKSDFLPLNWIEKQEEIPEENSK